ncbi:TauD/TfdA dioxygenase family protein [Streptomyces sp. MS2.AVA.5]|uniref:TauD/TfdA family dioxygenase n=1 Tax=Streptomyces achmelvichensis TaxID=3134111 RepID=A0ACC6PLY2_9ACTN
MTTVASLNIRKVAGHIGAHVGGIDLSRELAPDTITALRSALYSHKVLFFRGHHLNTRQLAQLATHFGQPTAAFPFDSRASRSPAADLHGALPTWHADFTCLYRPPSVGILRAMAVPAYGGDTLWANTARAYDTLPIGLRDITDRLRVIHSMTGSDYDKYRTRPQPNVHVTEHPLVAVHLETGERALTLGHWVRDVTGLPEPLTRSLLADLYSYITTPENTVRWHWQENDIALWDNRTTVHRGVADYDTAQPRQLQRITLAGKPLVSPSGEHSRSLSGDDTAYNNTPSTRTRIWSHKFLHHVIQSRRRQNP